MRKKYDDKRYMCDSEKYGSKAEMVCTKCSKAYSKQPTNTYKGKGMTQEDK